MFNKLLDSFVQHISDGNHIEGSLFAISGVFTVVFWNIYFLRSWTRGFEGENKRWEIPEVLVYLFCCWIAPMVVIAAAFLDIRPPDAVWYFLGAVTLFALLGRWGFEWLLALKNGSTKITTSSEVKVETTETKKE